MITARQARGFGRRAARDVGERPEKLPDAGHYLERDVNACPAIRPHATEYLSAFWDERVSIEYPKLHEGLGATTPSTSKESK